MIYWNIMDKLSIFMYYAKIEILENTGIYKVSQQKEYAYSMKKTMQSMNLRGNFSQTSPMRDMAIVIPTLEPNDKLFSYIGQLEICGFSNIIVVNDGSNHTFNEIFQRIGERKSCTVLVHEQNFGKGAALKTGYAYIQENLPNCSGIITADSDGQHAIKDICHIAEALLHHPKTLLLGSRDFSLDNIPIKSKVGNRLSSALFFLLFAKWLPDTQTGLRGFDVSLLSKMRSISGERFEYEMQVLAICATERIPIKRIPISTIYDNNNEGTHFQPIHDSFRVAKALFGVIGRYSASSGCSAIFDLGVAWFLLDFLIPIIPANPLLRIGTATIIARLGSMWVNYTINKKFVFRETSNHHKSSIKYILLCGMNVVASSLFVYTGFLGFGLGEKAAKLLGDTILFCINYQAQRIWVFGNEGKANESENRIS